MPGSSVTIDLKGRDAKLQSVLKRAGASIKRFATTVQQQLKRASLAFIAFGAWAVKTASNVEETMSKFNVVFGKNADVMKHWSDDTAASLKRAKGEVASFLASTQDLLVPMGMVSDEAEEMSKNVVKLTYDIASFNEKADPLVLQDMHSALTGSGEVMKKYGVILNETTTKQELLNQSLDPKTATNAQKAMARFIVILKGTQAAQGDLARTTESFANRLKALKGQFTDLRVEVGERLMPIAQKLVGVLGYLVKTIDADTLARWMKWTLIITTITIIVPKIIAVLKSMALAIKLVAGSQLFLLSLSGPAGWATIAIGLGIATAAAYELSEAWDSMAVAAEKSSKKAVKAAEETGDALAEVEANLKASKRGSEDFTLDPLREGDDKSVASLKRMQKTWARRLKQEKENLANLSATGFTDEWERRATVEDFEESMKSIKFNKGRISQFDQKIREAKGRDLGMDEDVVGKTMMQDVRKKAWQRQMRDAKEALEVAKIEGRPQNIHRLTKRKRDQGFQARFTGAEEMFRRISASRASRAAAKTPDEEAVKLLERANEQREAARKEREKLKKVIENLLKEKPVELNPIRGVVVGAL